MPCLLWTSREYVNEYYGWLQFELEGVIALCIVWDVSCDFRFDYNGWWWHTALDWFWFCLDVWNGLVSWWHWTSRKYVNMCACWNLKQGVIAWFSIDAVSSCNCALILFEYTAMVMTNGRALILILVEYMECYGIALVLDEQGVRWYFWCVCLNLNVSFLVRCPMHYNKIIIA